MFSEFDCTVVAQIFDRLFVPGEAICLGRGAWHTGTAPSTCGHAIIQDYQIYRAGAPLEACGHLEQLYVSTAVFAPGSTRQNANVVRVRCIPLDLDVANPWRTAPARFATVDDAVAALAGLGVFCPQFVYWSGYGVQAWLLLDEAVETPDAAARARVDAVFKALRRAVGSDPLSLSGLSRFPLSVHAKGGGQPKRFTSLIHVDLNHPGYRFDDIAAAFPVEDTKLNGNGEHYTAKPDDFPGSIRMTFDELPRELQQRILAVEPDRSRQIFHLVQNLSELDLGFEDIVGLLSQNRSLLERRGLARLHEDVLRILAKLQADVATAHGLPAGLFDGGN